MSELKAKLLVATPALVDPNFRQTVVLLLQGSHEEAFGIILNRESDRQIAEIWEVIFERPCPLEKMLYIGGPVFGPILALHTCKDFGDAEILPGLYLSSQKDAIENLVDARYQPFRLYVGGSGWGKNQLHTEIQQGAWFMIPANLEDVFEDPTELWKKSLERVGRGLLKSILPGAVFPSDSTLN